MLKYFSKQNRALLAELVRTDFKLRYQGSVLGYAWSLLRPLFMFIILYIVFTRVFSLGKAIPHYPVYLLFGIVLWNFFAEMTSQSTGAIVGRGDLIRKISIPRWLIIFSTSLSALINLALNLIVVVVFMFINHVGFHAGSPLALLPIIEIYFTALGTSLFLSAAFVRFRDISYIWEVFLQAGFYVTPIIYPLTEIKSHFFDKLIMISPLAQAIQDARYSAVTKKSITSYSLFAGDWFFYIPFILVVAILILGVWYFKRESKFFAENI